MKLIGLALAIGLVWDSALASLGWIRFTSGTLVEGAAPPWILGLWALFATTLNRSLAWLHGRYALAAVLGAIAGPLSYWAGARLGALELGAAGRGGGLGAGLGRDPPGAHASRAHRGLARRGRPRHGAVIPARLP